MASLHQSPLPAGCFEPPAVAKRTRHIDWHNAAPGRPESGRWQ